MAHWQEQIRHSLHQRDQREQATASLITANLRNAQVALQYHDRNRALLAAAAASASSGSRGAGGGAGGADNPVRAALITSLEQQLSSTRQDLSEQYKIQSTNSQRLLNLTDALREAEERSREEREELTRLRTEVEGFRERARWHSEIVQEKEKQLVILQDDHASLTLELTQLELRNEHLATDNAALLQRWLESKAEEAMRMNEANVFVEEAQRAKREREEREREGGKKEAEADAGEKA